MSVFQKSVIALYAWPFVIATLLSSMSAAPPSNVGSDRNECVTTEQDVLAAEWMKLIVGREQRQQKRGADQFVGYLRGRLNVSPPDWWVDAIRKDPSIDADASERTIKRLVKSWKTSSDGWAFHGVSSVTNEGDDLRVKLDGHDLLLKRALASDFSDLGWNSKDMGAVSGTFQDELFAMAVSCDEVGPSYIGVFLQDSGQLKWKRELRPTAPGQSSGGSWGAFTEVVINDNTVAIWVAHDYGVGMEILDRLSGESIAYFSSAQCKNAPETTESPVP